MIGISPGNEANDCLRLGLYIGKCQVHALENQCNFRMMLVNVGGHTKPTWCVSLQPNTLTGMSLTAHDVDLSWALDKLVALLPENEPPVPLKPTDPGDKISS